MKKRSRRISISNNSPYLTPNNSVSRSDNNKRNNNLPPQFVNKKLSFVIAKYFPTYLTTNYLPCLFTP